MVGPYVRPAYCPRCGKPYPWTESSLVAAREAADESELSAEDKERLKATFNDLAVDSPRTALAAHHFMTFVKKAGPVVGEVIKKTAIEFATETAKKMAGLSP